MLYLLIQNAIYGILEASLLWHQEFPKDLESQGFKFNAYGACVTNRTIDNKKHTVRFHVDGMLSSHVDSKVNDDFGKWLQPKYGAIKDVSTNQGKKQEFLGTELYLSEDGVCHVIHDSQIEDLIEYWPENLKSQIK